MNKDALIYVAGNTGLVGSAIVRNLLSRGYTNLLFSPYPDYDLRNQQVVQTFFEKNRPEYVIVAAAKVGGIYANNTYPAEFIYDNLMIESNIIHNSHIYGVHKLLFLGSSCIYPRICPQPIKEEYLLTGELEPTNEPYAIAKIAGIKLCQYYRKQYMDDFISAMPTNLYGPGDNYNLDLSHVLPAMIRKIHLANSMLKNDISSIKHNIQKHDGYPPNSLNDIYSYLEKYGIVLTDQTVDVKLWGTGTPRREFLFIDDLADALLHLMDVYSSELHVNVGVGFDVTIKEVAQLIKEIIGFEGTISWDNSKPDGTPQKLLDVTRINSVGWIAKHSLEDGIRMTYDNYVTEYQS